MNALVLALFSTGLLTSGFGGRPPHATEFAALVWTINGVTDEGVVSFAGVDVFQFDDAGLISSVRAFWKRGSLQRQLRRLRDAESTRR
jgi:hypothetical protein